MSKGKNEKVTAENAATEKVMTKYDRKMEKRRKEQEKEAKAQKRMRICGTVILVCIAALIIGSIAASVVKRYRTFNGTYIKVGEHELTKLEYDYYYTSVINNYLSGNSYFLSYMGLDTTKDYADQPYYGDENMTWKDAFDEMTVSQIQEVKALADEAKANSFTYDEAAKYESFLENLKTNAESAGISESEYYKEVYGEYATESRVEGFVKETLLAYAYYEKLQGDFAPSQEEIDTYYAENKMNYDTVSYRSFSFGSADVTSESEEADRIAKVEELQKTAEEFKTRLEAGEDFNALCAEYTEDEELKASYEDTEADYSLNADASYSSVSYAYSDWLFDEARTAGEITVIPDESSATCYVVKFESRNKDEETVNTSISDTLANQKATEYISGVVESSYAVTDVEGDMKYLLIPEETEASTEVTEETTADETTEVTETTGAEETVAETTTE